MSVGGMANTRKTIYSPVYTKDRAYHYLRINENQMQEKCKVYFKNWKLCRSQTTDKKGNGKYPLKG
jgi:hypothetical protein